MTEKGAVLLALAAKNTKREHNRRVVCWTPSMHLRHLFVHQ